MTIEENELTILLSDSNYRTYNIIIAKTLGIHSAIFLSHLISKKKYYQEHGGLVVCKGLEGCFFSTVEDIEKYTILSPAIQRKVKASLIKEGIISIHKVGIPAKNYFNINFGVLYSKLKEEMAKESVVLNGQNKGGHINSTSAAELTEHYNIKDNNKYNNNKNKDILLENDKESLTSEDISTVIENKPAKKKIVRHHMTIVNEYEETGEFNLNELASKVVLNKYTEESLKIIAIEFLDYYIVNKDKLKGKVNIKARFNKFVQNDFNGVLKKKIVWDVKNFSEMTQDEYEVYWNAGYLRRGSCPFYKKYVEHTLSKSEKKLLSDRAAYTLNKHLYVSFEDYNNKKNNVVLPTHK